MKTMKLKRLVQVLALLVAAGAWAHGTEHHGKAQHLMGTVKAVDEKTLTVELMDGKGTATVNLDAKTKYLKGKAAAARGDVTVGARVVVMAAKHGTEGLVASSVKLGAAGEQPAMSTGKATWSCPMHPEVVMDAAGKCPKCGMALVQSPAGTASPEKPMKMKDMKSMTPARPMEMEHGAHAH